MKRIPAFLALLGLLLWPVIAPAQLMLLGVGAQGGALPFGITFATSVFDATNLTTYSFAGASVGTDVSSPNKRYTLVATAGDRASSSVDVTSATICGVAATKIQSRADGGEPAGLFLADTTGQGATCTISVVFGGAMNDAGIGVWRMINPGSATQDGTACVDAAIGTATESITVIAGGDAVGYVFATGSVAPRTWTWTGLVEDFDATVESNDSHSGAHTASAGAPTTITAVASAATNDGAGCSGSWH